MTETELQRLVVRLVGDDSSYQKMFKEAEQSAKKFESTTKAVEKAEKMKDEAIKRGASITLSVEKATEKYDREMAELNTHLKQGTISQETFNRASKVAATNLKNATKGVADYGRQIAGAGAGMSAFVTAPIMAVGAAAVSAGMEIGTAFKGMKKTINEDYSGQLEEIKQQFRDSIEKDGTPIDLSEMLDIAGQAGQLGIKAENIVDFSQVIAELKVTTNMGDDAASTLARIANITNLPDTEYRNLASSIVALGNNTATTEAEISSMMLRLSASGTQAGMSVAEIAGFSAALSSVGITAEAGGTAFSQLFRDITTSIATGSKELEVFAKTAGVSVEKFKKDFRKDAAGAVQALLKGLSKLDNEEATLRLQQMGIEGGAMSDAMGRAALSVDKLGAAIKLSSEEYIKNEALTNESAVAFAGFGAATKNLSSIIKNFGGDIFKIIEPALRMVINLTRDVVNTFIGMDDELKTIAVGFLAASAAIGPLLVAVGTTIILAPQMAAGWAIASGALATYGTTAGIATLATKALSIAMKASPFLLIGAGLVTVTALVVDLISEYRKLNDELEKSKTLNNQLITDSKRRVEETVAQAESQAKDGNMGAAKTTLELGLGDAESRLEGFRRQVKDAAADVRANAWNVIDRGALKAARAELEEALDRMRAGQREVALLKAATADIDNVKKTESEAEVTSGKVEKVVPPETIKAIEALDKAMQNQIDTFGMTSREAQIYQLKLNGATEETLKFVTAMDKGLTAKEEAAKLAAKTEAETKKRTADGKALVEQFLPPEAKLQKEKDRLKGLLDEGLIDEHTFGKASEAAEKTFGDIEKIANDKKISVGIEVREAVGAGSAEAMARIQSFLDQGASIDPTKELNRASTQSTIDDAPKTALTDSEKQKFLDAANPEMLGKLPSIPELENQGNGWAVNGEAPSGEDMNRAFDAINSFTNPNYSQIRDNPNASREIRSDFENGPRPMENRVNKSEGEDKAITLDRIAVAAERLVVINEERPLIELQAAGL